MSIKNSNDTIGNRSRDLPVCSAVPQPLRHRVPHSVTTQTQKPSVFYWNSQRNYLILSTLHMFMARHPIAGLGLLQCWGFAVRLSNTLGRTPLEKWSSRRTDRYLTTYNTHKRERHTHGPGGIRTRNISKRAAADSRLRPRCHWYRPYLV
jgi:hypothetical protein